MISLPRNHLSNNPKFTFWLDSTKNKRPQRGLNDHQLFCFFNDFCEAIFFQTSGSLTLANNQNSQKSFRYGFFYVKFLFLYVVCVVFL